MPYDALLVLSFGGPERHEDVIPFLENVLRGKNVPRERMLEVAEHYYKFDGRSPISEQNRALVAAVQEEFEENGPKLPVYWGNRNWHPLLADTLRTMSADGVKQALVFVTSAFGSFSGCRQYLDDMVRARDEVGPSAPQLDKLRSFYNHPRFIEALIERTQDALAQVRPEAELVFTAHSIPVSMAETSPYEAQLREACDWVAQGAGHPQWQLAYQSRSGPPSQAWLEPDIGTILRRIAAGGNTDVAVCPIGFVSDHLEVVYDLDYEAAALARELGLRTVRAKTAGVHPRFITMIRELVLERISSAPRLAVPGSIPRPDECASDCCPRPQFRR
jgi:protoporphyrin/coproporphyrin ferrochelatase